METKNEFEKWHELVKKTGMKFRRVVFAYWTAADVDSTLQAA